MTEYLTCRDISRLLHMEDCVTFEVPDGEMPQGPPRAFLMVPFATRHPKSVDRFRQYFLGDVFDSSRLRYSSPAEESAFQGAMAGGNIMYLSEFVSPHSRAVNGGPKSRRLVG